MDATQNDEQLTRFFSTYGLITAERILGTYQISLPSSELLDAIKSPHSFYHKLVQVPLRNVLNGIILEQAHDYHIYAQKLFIDYLLSGESAKDPESQGAGTREQLENERKELVTLGENFHKVQQDHNGLIGKSQASLIEMTSAWKQAFELVINQLSGTLGSMEVDVKKATIKRALNHALIHTHFVANETVSNTYLFVDVFNEIIKLSMTDELKPRILDDMAPLLDIVLNFDTENKQFLDEVTEFGLIANSYRTQFYDKILRVIELIKYLPDYKINPEQDQVNREALHFDRSIGQL